MGLAMGLPIKQEENNERISNIRIKQLITVLEITPPNRFDTLYTLGDDIITCLEELLSYRGGGV